jgi:hypothetical protein
VLRQKEKGKTMALTRNVLRAIVAALAVGFLWVSPIAVAQTIPGAGSPSVRPTGGGKALLNTSDSVSLLLDHQAGLFQTVKDISVPELRELPSRGWRD